MDIRARAEHGPAVCWLRIGNSTNPFLIQWFEARLGQLVAGIDGGETIIELR